MNGQTDDRQKVITKAHLVSLWLSGELKFKDQQTEIRNGYQETLQIFYRFCTIGKLKFCKSTFIYLRTKQMQDDF